MNSTMDNQIAVTMLQQIGGRRFIAMTGSHDFINLGNGLRMSLSRNKTSANRLEILYDHGAWKTQARMPPAARLI